MTTFIFSQSFHPHCSSPHLVHVRERIRINGRPLSEDDFAKYFQYVYGCLDKAVKVLDLPMFRNISNPYFILDKTAGGLLYILFIG